MQLGFTGFSLFRVWGLETGGDLGDGLDIQQGERSAYEGLRFHIIWLILSLTPSSLNRPAGILSKHPTARIANLDTQRQEVIDHVRLRNNMITTAVIPLKTRII